MLSRAVRSRRYERTASAYNIGMPRRGAPSGNILFNRSICGPVRSRPPAPAFSTTWSISDAFGITNEKGQRSKNWRATWRGVALFSFAISCNRRPAGRVRMGEVPVPKRAVGHERGVMLFAPGNDGMLHRPFLQMIQNLIADRTGVACLAGGLPADLEHRSC